MPKISYQILKNNIKNNKISNLYYFYGKEDYLIKYYTKKITENFIKIKNNFNLGIFSLEEKNLERICNFIENFPVGDSKKCVIIKNFGILKKEDFKFLLEIISDIPEFAILIIQNFSEENNNKLFLDKISKSGILVEFSNKNLPIEKQIIIWVQEFGKILNFENAKLISEICNQNLNLIKNNIQKICLISQDREINSENINKIFGKYNNFRYNNIFEINQNLISGNYSQIFKIINNLISQKTEPVIILSAILTDYLDIYRIKLAQENNIKPEELANFFDYKNREFRIKKAEQNFKNFELKKIVNFIKIFIEIDKLLKSTRISPVILLDYLVMKLIINFGFIKK